MLTRRGLLAGGALSFVGVVGGMRAVESPISISRSASSEGDWPMARFDATGTASNPAASGPKDGVRVRWECEPESSVLGPAPPILAGDTLFVVGRGSLIAIDRETGAVRFERGGDSYLSGPTRVAASAYRADALAVESRGGIYGLAADGGYGVGERSVGLERWHAPGREPVTRTSATPAVPSLVASGGSVYAVVPDTNRVVALDANSGRVRWEQAIGAARSSQPNRPVVRDGTVYVTSWPDHVAAFDAESGARDWGASLEPAAPEFDGDYRDVSAPTATSEGLVVPSRRAVSLLNPADGHLQWEYVHGGGATDGSVAVADRTVFVADGVESLHAVDLETGEAVWTAAYRHDVHPVVADAVVYLAYFWLPELVAIDAQTGDRRWRYRVGHGPSQPVVGDGVLYVVSHDRVVALEEGS